MASTEVIDRRVERLADDLRAKILANAALIADAEGEITVRIFRRGDGFDIKLVTTH
jgi:hypothetical protein